MSSVEYKVCDASTSHMQSSFPDLCHKYLNINYNPCIYIYK